VLVIILIGFLFFAGKSSIFFFNKIQAFFKQFYSPEKEIKNPPFGRQRDPVE